MVKDGPEKWSPDLVESQEWMNYWHVDEKYDIMYTN